MSESTALQPSLDKLDHAIKTLEAGLKGPVEEKKAVQSQPVTEGTTVSEEKIQRDKARKQAKLEQKKKKKEKAAAVATGNAVDQTLQNFLQCNLCVGRVQEVDFHDEADGLYILKVNYGKTDGGEEEVRTVCAGLRKFVPKEELEQKLVVTITNLKPRKLRGVTSEAMILAGSSVSSEGSKEVVKPIVPPSSATERTLLGLEKKHGERDSNPKNVSSKLWEKVSALFSVLDGKACYDGKPMTIGDEFVTCDLPDKSEIH